MAEYIERERAIVDACNSLELYPSEYAKLEDALNKIPAADVSPVRHGRWIEKEKYSFGVMYDCSICDNRILDNGHSWNYCPNCGAIMNSYKQENKR